MTKLVEIAYVTISRTSFGQCSDLSMLRSVGGHLRQYRNQLCSAEVAYKARLVNVYSDNINIFIT